MKYTNVTSIEVETVGENPRKLIYNVELFRKLNDLRQSVGTQTDKRTVVTDRGDGWADQTEYRDVLLEHVDQFIESLDKSGLKYELKYN
jgi:hypothetical protein